MSASTPATGAVIHHVTGNRGRRRLRSAATVAAMMLALVPANLALPSPAEAVPSSMSARSAPSVTLSTSRRSAAVGKELAFTGRAPARATVSLQYLVGRTWRTLGTTKSTSKGTYVVRAKQPKVGGTAVLYRAVAKGKTSGILKVGVTRPARTYDLVDFIPTRSMLDLHDTTEIGSAMLVSFVGVTKYASLDPGANYIGTWKVDGRCSRLTGVAGSTRSSAVRVQVAADGNPLFSTLLQPGESVPLSVPLGGRKNVSIAVAQTNFGFGGEAGIGNARITCTTRPDGFRPLTDLQSAHLAPVHRQRQAGIPGYAHHDALPVPIVRKAADSGPIPVRRGGIDSSPPAKE